MGMLYDTYSDITSQTPHRYLNILRDLPVGANGSLGASDAVMAMIGAYYLIFPRHRVHVFRKADIVLKLGADMGGKFIKEKAQWLRSWSPRASAIWLLPMMFLTGQVEINVEMYMHCNTYKTHC